MAYNLIVERWIPIERRSGKVEMIAPAQVAEREDPPVRIASPRPDFDGALLEFLIGLLQTVAAPKTELAWEKEFEAPPSPAELNRRFGAVKNAFFLDGDGPRFMQDLNVASDPKAASVPIGALLVDRIGEDGLSEAPTLFAKSGLYETLGYPAAAAALMALQSYAPAGGRGQFTSLRGGGPLTTLVVGADLWATAWLNVLPRSDYELLVPGDPSLTDAEATFPWMARTRKGPTPPKRVHPLQHLWGLPRRCRLDLDAEPGRCAVYGDTASSVIRQYRTRPEGTSYEGDYRHPWTPYSFAKAGEPWNPKKGGADGLPYRDWPLLVTGNDKRSPAIVVSHFARTRRRELVVGVPRLLAFGYAMDNMKPLRWCRAETPLITVRQECADVFAGTVDGFVAASEEIRKTLLAQVKGALSNRPGDIDVAGHVNPAFWSETEPAFFRAVHDARQELESNLSLGEDVGQRWLESLHRSAMRLFDSFASAPAELAPPDMRRTVLARRSLDQFTNPSALKLRKLLGLTVEEKAARPASGARTRNHGKEKRND